MAINLSDYVCEFCGKPCTQIVFAAFLCDSPECMEKAFIARGGPGGHMNAKMEGRPIIPTDLEETAEEFNEEYGDKKDRPLPASRLAAPLRTMKRFAGPWNGPRMIIIRA